ncbi:MAG TPA: hypothetical protein VFZ09_15335 [Archangium sp.]|uniref:hypothetical protein n=1 Tax=Archangium sp. TaxID=1872627 RepID=UPI002E314E31|nr:hypothetical protein [Archangium sp.]HEX5747619.1 hypothetical protein [Archangium sp.]
MVGFSTALLATVLASLAPVVPVSGGNALTLPAQRHAVRIDTGSGRPPTWLFAVQQEGAEGRGLSFFRSDDGGRTFRFAAAIQPDASHADRAEVLAVGRDVALVYSYEAPKLAASRRHDVYFHLALALPSRCADCQVQARLQAFGVDEAGLVVRAEGDARYALVLLPRGRIQLRRYRGGGFTVLGEAASGQASPRDAATLSLSVWGAGPVRLSASVDGQVRLSVTDADPAALTGEGDAGLATPIAGVWFDDFLVRALGTGP